VLNSDRFLWAFNEIHDRLAQLSGEDKRTSFVRLVELLSSRDQVVRRYADDLHEFADLRNAIVHERLDDRVIAEPNDWAVAQIERIRSLVVDPPKVIDLFGRKVMSLSSDQPVRNAVKLLYEGGISQVPIYSGRDFAGLLTERTLARWLGACADEGIFSLTKTTIGEVMAHGEDGENFRFVKESLTVIDALDLFSAHQRQGRRLSALLITKNGSPSEKLLGIMTIWDVPHALKAVELRSE
jgi:CBS domain-containing protein